MLLAEVDRFPPRLEPLHGQIGDQGGEMVEGFADHLRHEIEFRVADLRRFGQEVVHCDPVGEAGLDQEIGAAHQVLQVTGAQGRGVHPYFVANGSEQPGKVFGLFFGVPGREAFHPPLFGVRLAAELGGDAARTAVQMTPFATDAPHAHEGDGAHAYPVGA